MANNVKALTVTLKIRSNFSESKGLICALMILAKGFSTNTYDLLSLSRSSRFINFLVDKYLSALSAKRIKDLTSFELSNRKGESVAANFVPSETQSVTRAELMATGRMVCMYQKTSHRSTESKPIVARNGEF